MSKQTIKFAGLRLDRFAAVKVYSYTYTTNQYGHKFNVTVRVGARRISKGTE